MQHIKIKQKTPRMPRLAILLIFILCIGSFAGAETDNSNSFYFVQITDTHFGAPSSLIRTSMIIESINSLPYKIDFAVLTGDIFDKKLDKKEVDEALKTLKELKIPLHVIAGNHDLASYDTAFYTGNFGKLNYSLDHKGYRLAFISSLHPESNPVDDAVSQFEKQLSGNKLPVILFHHEPFLDRCYSTESLKTWEDLLTRHKCVAIVSGHFHRAGMSWFGEIPEYIAPCVVKFRGRQASYRLYKCQNHRLSYATFYIQVPYESMF